MKVTILTGCIAGKKARAMGADVDVDEAEARLLCNLGQAAKPDSDAAKAAKKAAADASKGDK